MLMKTEGLTNSQFALRLGIQRSNITHIIDGRNKPSFSFIEKLLLEFPSVNPEWLITGAGEMYKHKEKKKSDSPTLFPENDGKQKTQTTKKTVPDVVQISKQDKTQDVVQISEQDKTQDTKPEQLQNVVEQKPAELTPVQPNPKPVQQAPEQLSVPESNLIEKIKEQEIECVLIFYADKTFKYYKPF
jgi:transcriptional regulator with XRE-family HTH domain